MMTLTLRPMVHLPPFFRLRLCALAAWRAARRAWMLGRQRQQRWLHERESLHQLHRMDDALLADIGLARCDLPWISRRNALAQVLDDVTACSRAHRVFAPARSRGSRN